MFKEQECRSAVILLHLLYEDDSFAENRNDMMLIYGILPDKFPCLSNQELEFIISTFSEPHKKRAWNMLVTRNPINNISFACIMAIADAPYDDLALGVLKERELRAIDFCVALKYVKDGKRRQKAWNMIIELPHDDSYCFRYIIDYVDQPYKDKALEEFLKRKFPIQDLKEMLCARSGKETLFFEEKIRKILYQH